MIQSKEASEQFQMFEDLKKSVAIIDPVAFAESYLTIDGKPFRMTGNGWRWMTELYREVAAQATSKTAKPMVILKGRQIGATILAAVLSLYFTASGLYGTGQDKPPMRVLHAFPTLGIMAKYAKDKLNPMMQGSQGGFISKRSLKKDKALGKDANEDTITEKTFIGFNKLRVDSIGKDADRLRGLSQDVLLLDEVQDMAKHAIENALRILTSAQYGPPQQGIQLYFGTPKNAGSYFWQIWEASDQRFFQPRCLKCDQYFFFYTIGSDEWKRIWVKEFEIKCPFCEHLQDKREAIERGRWEPTKDPKECKYIGYHCNLLLSPLFRKESVMDYDPEVNTNRSMRAWKNETLGEFYTSGGVPLEMDDITWDMSRSVAKSVTETADKIYTMGIDWGDKGDDELSVEEGGAERGQSYTTIAILSLDRRGVYTLENAFRLKKNDFTYQVEVVSELWRMFKIKQCAADYMWGQSVVGHFQSQLQYGDKFLGCVNSGNLGSKFSYKANDLRVVLNKDLVLEDVFTMFKKGKIVFPGAKGSYDLLHWCALNCCSMETRTAQRYGSYVKKFVKGTSPNDALMSIMYALVAAKFISSGGFKNAENAQKSQRPMPVMAYAPKMR